MNRKQFILVLLASLVIGGAGLVLVNQHNDAWAPHEAKVGDRILPRFQFNDVASIQMKGETNLNLTRADGTWRVQERGGYAADYQQIRDLLVKMRDLKIVQSEKIGLSQLGHVNLDVPGKGAGSGTLVEFKDAQGNVLDSLLMGKKHLRPKEGSAPIGLQGLYDGRYVLLPGDSGNVLLISDELASLVPEPATWLSREFFKIEHVKSISVISGNGANLWTLLRENESWPWTLADAKPGETLDATAAAQTAEIPGFLSFTDVAANASSAETGLDKPMTIFIETFDHLFYTLKIARKSSEGNYFMAIAVTSDFPAQRIVSTGESADDKQKLDEEFQDKTKRLVDKLRKEQALSRWVYAVGPRIIESLVRDRKQLLEKYPIAGEQGVVPTLSHTASSQ